MKKGLGKGLEALFAIYDNETQNETYGKEIVTKTFSAPTNDIDINLKAQGSSTEISIDKIYPNPNQPRKIFDKESLHELATSIKTHGLIQPIIVNKTDDGYMIIAGERRYRACKIAGLKTISCIIKRYTPRQIAEISIIENLQREDLNPVEMAKGIKKLMDEYDITQEEVADRIGKSRSGIANVVRILNLYPEVLELVEKGKVSFGHAKCLVAVTDYINQVLLAKKVAQNKLTVRDLEVEIQSMYGDKKQNKKPLSMSAELRDFVSSMQKRLGTKVSIIGNDKKGRIYIDYYSQDDLDRLYQIIFR
ncbi:MAG: ParB/RepB/Spo0J family partition protein [Clostridia bacterium]|nr:ParB/RepB/Spo0J family partition protein [Clostridia bacterium]